MKDTDTDKEAVEFLGCIFTGEKPGFFRDKNFNVSTKVPRPSISPLLAPTVVITNNRGL